MTNPQFSEMGALEEIEDAVVGMIGTKIVDSQFIETKVRALASALFPGASDEQILGVVASVETRVNVRTPGGTVVQSSHVNWLNQERKQSIEWLRWEAYRQLLQEKKMPIAVIDGMSTRADHILNLSGDPQKDGAMSRRGLVIGDVQSGKTANYLALFNKAADAGYRVIILMGGHTDKLRKQTQLRVDEGFVGRDSRLLGKGLKSLSPNIQIGVGKKAGVVAQGFTTVNSDFSAAMLTGANVDIKSMTVPVIFVIKKNKRIIDNLTAWLRSQTGEDSQLAGPLLLLDDEADFASINTNNAESDPTAINKGLRDLLSVFTKNSYVGFTATPFANVLIDDEVEEDLFPRDFIYALESPSNYFGPDKMFEGNEDQESPFLRLLGDVEDVIPLKHKSTHPVVSLPGSLVTAVRTFFLANAIRDLRGQEKAPRSMLVNVSRFVKVQDQVHQQLVELVAEMRNSISYESRDNSHAWQELKNTWEREFSELEFSWEMVANELKSAIADIQVRVVNSNNNTDDWDNLYQSDRARIIAVGGDVLSRGLTLDGLSTSYFYRRSVAYDTLMQMGRWFGYRDGYVDLCRLWIDPEVSTWYAFIAAAIHELRADLRVMQNSNLTPKDFGLAVRRHPGSVLTVTALNKARNATAAHKISLRDKTIETPRLVADPAVIAKNWESFATLVEKLVDGKFHQKKSHSGHLQWTDVEPKLVADFLNDFEPSNSELLFQGGLISSHIASSPAPWMAKWQVLIMGGNGGTDYPKLKCEFQLVERAIRVQGETLFVGGTKMRLGGRGDVGQVLPASVRALVSETVKSEERSEATDEDYRAHLDCPLLIVYPLKASSPDGNAKTMTRKGQEMPIYKAPQDQVPIVGVSLSFPRGTGTVTEAETVSYLVSTVYQKQQRLLDIFDEVDPESVS